MSCCLQLFYVITCSVSERMPSPVASTTALGVSLAVALANTPKVGKLESTMPMASYPTSGPKSLLRLIKSDTVEHCYKEVGYNKTLL